MCSSFVDWLARSFRRSRTNGRCMQSFVSLPQALHALFINYMYDHVPPPSFFRRSRQRRGSNEDDGRSDDGGGDANASGSEQGLQGGVGTAPDHRSSLGLGGDRGRAHWTSSTADGSVHQKQILLGTHLKKFNAFHHFRHSTKNLVAH